MAKRMISETNQELKAKFAGWLRQWADEIESDPREIMQQSGGVHTTYPRYTWRDGVTPEPFRVEYTLVIDYEGSPFV